MKSKKILFNLLFHYQINNLYESHKKENNSDICKDTLNKKNGIIQILKQNKIIIFVLVHKVKALKIIKILMRIKYKLIIFRLISINERNYKELDELIFKEYIKTKNI